MIVDGLVVSKNDDQKRQLDDYIISLGCAVGGRRALSHNCMGTAVWDVIISNEWEPGGKRFPPERTGTNNCQLTMNNTQKPCEMKKNLNFVDCLGSRDVNDVKMSKSEAKPKVLWPKATNTRIKSRYAVTQYGCLLTPARYGNIKANYSRMKP